jgi:hypothetical protein
MPAFTQRLGVLLGWTFSAIAALGLAGTVKLSTSEDK